MGYKTETHRHRQQYGGYWKEGGEGAVNCKGAKYMVMEDDLTLGGGHTMQYTDYVSEIYTWNLNSLIYQCQPNTFYKNKNIIYNSIDLFMH